MLACIGSLLTIVLGSFVVGGLQHVNWILILVAGVANGLLWFVVMPRLWQAVTSRSSRSSCGESFSEQPDRTPGKSKAIPDEE
jgi:hypothetical protein